MDPLAQPIHLTCTLPPLFPQKPSSLLVAVAPATMTHISPTCSSSPATAPLQISHRFPPRSTPLPLTLKAELTAGYCGTRDRDAYLPAMLVLARHGISCHLTGAELTNVGQPPSALAAPEALLLQLRGVAAALGVPVTLGNAGVGFEGRLLAEVERKAFECGCYQGVDVPPVSRLMYAEMGDAMFESKAWPEFRDWAARVRQRAAALGGAAAAAAAAQHQQQQQPPSFQEAAASAQYQAPPQQSQQQQQQQDRGGPGQRHAALLV